MASCCRSSIILLALAAGSLAAPTASEACPSTFEPIIAAIESDSQLGSQAITITAFASPDEEIRADLYIDDFQIGSVRLHPIEQQAGTKRGTFVIGAAIWDGMPRPLTIRVEPSVYRFGELESVLASEWFTILDGPPPARASGADQLLFAFFAVSLFGVVLLYRREESAEQRIRLIAAAGLIAVLFLCTAPAMPWSEGITLDENPELCMLGDEARCIAEQAAFAGVSPTELELTLERTNWATAGIRAGHMTLLILLLPAFIWLMVAPHNRGAQALVLGGVIPAAVTALSTIAYGVILGSWTVRAGGAPDLTLVVTGTLIVVSVIAGFTGRRLRLANHLPVARVRR